eukprot:363145-Chlamydomonas_euryale.AAC.7
MVQADDDEVVVDEEQDEFADEEKALMACACAEADHVCKRAAEHFQALRPPKVLVTTCYKPSKVMYTFLSEMLVSGRQRCGTLHASHCSERYPAHVTPVPEISRACTGT